MIFGGECHTVSFYPELKGIIRAYRGVGASRAPQTHDITAQVRCAAHERITAEFRARLIQRIQVRILYGEQAQRTQRTSMWQRSIASEEALNSFADQRLRVAYSNGWSEQAYSGNHCCIL